VGGRRRKGARQRTTSGRDDDQARNLADQKAQNRDEIIVRRGIATPILDAEFPPLVWSKEESGGVARRRCDRLCAAAGRPTVASGLRPSESPLPLGHGRRARIRVVALLGRAVARQRQVDVRASELLPPAVPLACGLGLELGFRAQLAQPRNRAPLFRRIGPHLHRREQKDRRKHK